MGDEKVGDKWPTLVSFSEFFFLYFEFEMCQPGTRTEGVCEVFCKNTLEYTILKSTTQSLSPVVRWAEPARCNHLPPQIAIIIFFFFYLFSKYIFLFC